jgi:hypothetical protein
MCPMWRSLQASTVEASPTTRTQETTMTKLVVISGGLRSASTDSALVRAAAQYALIHPDAAILDSRRSS